MKKEYSKIDAFSIVKNEPVKVNLRLEELYDKNIFNKEIKRRLIRLNRIYQKIPETKCPRCNDCCKKYNINNVYSIEYLNILNYVKNCFSQDKRAKLLSLAKINLFIKQRYKNKGIKKGKVRLCCIFIDEKNKCCSIYEYRPLTCRLLGLEHLFSNNPKQKSKCSRMTRVNKKKAKRLNPSLVNRLWKEIGELSDNFIYYSKHANQIITTKSLALDEWFTV